MSGLSSIARTLLCLVALCAAFLMLFVTPSCTAMGPLKQPQEAWVHADRMTYDVIGPRFAKYVHDDGALMPVEKKALLDLMVDWRVRLEQAELVIKQTVLVEAQRVDARAPAAEPVEPPLVIFASRAPASDSGPPGDDRTAEAAWLYLWLNAPALGLTP